MDTRRWAIEFGRLTEMLMAIAESVAEDDTRGQIEGIAATLKDASIALAKSATGHTDVKSAEEIAEIIIQVYSDAQKRGIINYAKQVLRLELFEDIMLAMLFNARWMKSGKGPSTRYEALEDTTQPGRRLPAIALGLSGDREAVPLLIQCLNDHDTNVRVHSAIALGQLQDDRAVEPLIESLLHDDDRGVRWSAADALGLVGDGRARDALNQATNDESVQVQQAAEAALAKLQ